MTNLDYIIQNMTERDIAEFIYNSEYANMISRSNIAKHTYKAFMMWKSTLTNKQNNFKNKKKTILIQIWLSKQYDPNEWSVMHK